MALPSHAWEWKNPFVDEGVVLEIMVPYLDLRTGPTRGHPVFHVIERGDKIRVMKKFTGWYLVRTNKNIEGWVKGVKLNGSRFEDGVLAEVAIPGKKGYDARKLEFGLAAGTFAQAQAFSIYSDYHLTPNISAEVKYTQAFGEYSIIRLYSANLIHQTFPNWWISPFFILGAGIMQTEPNSGLGLAEDREDSVLTTGGGLFIYASRNFLVRMEYNNHSALTTRAENEEVHEWKAGFSVFF